MNNKADQRIKLKLSFILVCVIFIIFISFLSLIPKQKEIKVQQDNLITTKEIEILMEALLPDFSWNNTNTYFTYNDANRLLNYLNEESILMVKEQKKEECFFNLFEDKVKRTNNNNNDYMTKVDWYAIFDCIDEYFDLFSQINKKEVIILGIGSNISDENGTLFQEDFILTDSSLYEKSMIDALAYQYKKVEIYEKEKTLLLVSFVVSDIAELKSVWLRNEKPGYLQGFYNNYSITFSSSLVDKKVIDQVGDLYFENGILQSYQIKTNKIHGKILSVEEDFVDIEGYGKVLFSQHCRNYQIYEKLESVPTNRLNIGYDFTDFILEDKKIIATITTKDIAMEQIRVLIQASNYGGYYHTEVSFVSQDGCKIIYGEGEEVIIDSNEIVTIDKNSPYFSQNRIQIIPSGLSSSTQLLSVERSQGNPHYQGILELERREEGIIIVNELLLEEYLHVVVPSEMPAYYPMEALKAQAICARTYAYGKMKQAGLPQFGAHLDDSVLFQVYNNSGKVAQTNEAVRKTKGMILDNNGEVAPVFYYSTSFGTIPEGMTFEEAILSKNPLDHEVEEGWYRWTYSVEKLNVSIMEQRINNRFQVNPAVILTKEGNEFISVEPKSLGKIKSIAIEKRGESGVAEELIIQGENSTIKVVGEYSIRYVLCDGTTKVLRQDGTKSTMESLTPSGFCTINSRIENGNVIGYDIVGGGFGHGNGMSQNGAKCMAENEMTTEEILQKYYHNYQIVKIYKE